MGSKRSQTQKVSLHGPIYKKCKEQANPWRQKADLVAAVAGGMENEERPLKVQSFLLE